MWAHIIHLLLLFFFYATQTPGFNLKVREKTWEIIRFTFTIYIFTLRFFCYFIFYGYKLY